MALEITYHHFSKDDQLKYLMKYKDNFDINELKERFQNAKGADIPQGYLDYIKSKS